MTRRPNRVRATRESLGINQRSLAGLVGLSRQSLSAIESGTSEPSVGVALRIAQALGRKTEDLFGDPGDDAGPLRIDLAPSPTGTASSRVVLARLDGRWVGHALSGSESCHAADAILEPAPQRSAGVRVSGSRCALLAPERDLPETVLVSGCAPALGALADRVAWSRGGPRAIWLDRSNTAALAELRQGHVSIAGVHGDAIEKVLRDWQSPRSDPEWVIVTLARWRAGLVVASGNPLGIVDAPDACARGARWVVREQGSGARGLLERELQRAGLDGSSALRAALDANGHLAVARAVAIGAADVGMAIEPVAVSLGLGFVPVVEERFDLVLARTSLAEPRVQRVLDVLASAAFRADVAALGGYDIRETGERQRRA